MTVLFRFPPIRPSISLIEWFAEALLVELGGTDNSDRCTETDLRSERSATLRLGADKKDRSGPKNDGFSETFRSLTVFISLRNAAILSGAMPTVGIPALREGSGLIGFSTGVGA